MARARNIKPGFFQNEVLAELPCADRLFFIGLWTVADFKGCIEYRPKRLKVAIMPYEDNFSVEESVARLNKSGFVRIYSVLSPIKSEPSQRYLKIANFEIHQRPHKNEIASGTSLPDEDEAHVQPQLNQTVTEKTELSPIKSEPLALNTSSLILNTKEREEETPIGVSGGSVKVVEELFEFWQTVHCHPTAHLTIERRRKVTERLKAGYSVEDIQEAILGCKISPHHQGQNEHGKIYDDLELICRSDTKLEQFIGYKRQPEIKRNGSTKNGNYGRKRTDPEILAESAEFYANYPG